MDKVYDFDYVFPLNTNESTVYKSAVDSLVQNMLIRNENSCIITYGQKSLNKTEFMFMHSD